MTGLSFDPVLTTRLCIRPVSSSDLLDLLVVNGDAAVTWYLPYATWRSIDDGQAWFDRMQTLSASGASVQLVIERRSDRVVVGTVLLFGFDESSARLELGYVVGRQHWRQGYAHEALRAVCTVEFCTMGIRRIEAEVNPDNLASNALLKSLGFVLEGRLRGRWVTKGVVCDTHVYGCLAHEWTSESAAIDSSPSANAGGPPSQLR